MARIKSGILGGFSGKAGAIIGYQMRGKSFIRGLSKSAPAKPSAKQLANRAKFRLLQNWRSALTEFFAITFKNHTHERSAQNSAHHFNSQIVKGEYPDFIIDYASIVISEGTLPGLKEVSMHIENEMLHFTWLPNVIGQAKHRDLIALLVLYEKETFYQGDLNLADRRDGKGSFETAFPGDCNIGHVYLTVISNDRDRAANSVYLGEIERIK